MDPVSQGLIGAAAAQVVLGPRLGNRAWIAGAAGGMIPDIDFLLEPLSDPALPWEYHRHFTHSLVMAPVMGLLAALPLLRFKAMRAAPWLVILAAILGAFTHAPVDWLTSFGTRILWPFTDQRFAADLFPIIDPVFTLVFLVCVVVAARRRTRMAAGVGFVFFALYLGYAIVQHGHAADAQATLAERRDQTIERARVLPQPASLFVWRSVYLSEGRLHADMVRVAPLGDVSVSTGSSVPLLDVTTVEAPSEPARVADVLEKFAAFADDYVAYAPGEPAMVGDMRYGVGPTFDPLWGIRLGTSPGEPSVRWASPGLGGGRVGLLWDAILGRDSSLVPLEAALR